MNHGRSSIAKTTLSDAWTDWTRRNGTQLELGRSLLGIDLTEELLA